MLSTQRKLQATATINLALPLIKKDGSQATGLALNTLSTKIIKPDGTALAGYTEAIFTEPNGDGIYNIQLPLNAAVKAFTLEDQNNPYTVTLDSSTADVEPTSIEVWIVSRLAQELSRAGDILVDPATDKIDGSNMAKDSTVAKGEDLAIVAGYISNGAYGLSALNTDLDALLGRLTATRALLLDNLINADVKTSTRAALVDLLGSKTSSVIQQMVTVQDGEQLIVRRGAKKTFTFTFSADFPLDGTEKIYFTWKKDPNDAVPAVDKLCTITDAAKRTCSVDFTAVEMTIDPGNYKAEVTIYDAAMAAATVRKPVACDIYVEQNVRA